MRIAPVAPSDLPEFLELLRAYLSELPIDLEYQAISAELGSLPGKYAPPNGALLMARDAHGAAIGCIALRAFNEPGVCEMKRLYVAPAGRSQGLGHALALAIMEAARSAGYREMRLDTLDHMYEAQALYRALGFVEIGAYYYTPVPNTVFMSLRLI